MSTLKLIVNEYHICPRIVTKAGRSALHLAARNGHVNVAKLLVEMYGLNVDEVGASGATALHRASGKKQLKIIEYLVGDQCANMEIQRNEDGYTPLMLAAYYNKYESVQMLLDYGANIEALSFGGCTSAHIAMQRNNFKSLYHLICRGANIDVVCKECTVRSMAQIGSGKSAELRECVGKGLREYREFYDAVSMELSKEFEHLYSSDIIAEIMDAAYPKAKCF